MLLIQPKTKYAFKISFFKRTACSFTRDVLLTFELTNLVNVLITMCKQYPAPLDRTLVNVDGISEVWKLSMAPVAAAYLQALSQD